MRAQDGMHARGRCTCARGIDFVGTEGGGSAREGRNRTHQARRTCAPVLKCAMWEEWKCTLGAGMRRREAMVYVRAWNDVRHLEGWFICAHGTFFFAGKECPF